MQLQVTGNHSSKQRARMLWIDELSMHALQGSPAF